MLPSIPTVGLGLGRDASMALHELEVIDVDRSRPYAGIITTTPASARTQSNPMNVMPC